MKNWFIYILLNLIEGFANLAATIFSALIVIALYKTTSTMQIDKLLNSITILEHNDAVIRMSFMVLIAICVRTVCEKLKRKFDKS